MTEIEWLRCTLPVIRQTYSEDIDDYITSVAPCGEQMELVKTESGTLDVDGPWACDGDVWKVECHLGHVLLMPDYEGNDCTGIPFDAEARAALLGFLRLATTKAQP